MSYIKQYEIGLSGLALLRTWLIEDDKVIKGILEEIQRLLKGKSSNKLLRSKSLNIQDGYKIWSESYDSFPNLLIEIEEPVVRKLILEFPKGKVFDAACGTGRYSGFLHSLGHKVIGMDLSNDMLQKAKAKNHDIQYIKGDMLAIPFHDNSFDIAISALALTHLTNLDKAISELTRVVKQGGHIILSDIHPWFIVLGGQAYFFDKEGNYNFIRNHIHWHNLYLKAFEKAGLKIIECIEPVVEHKHLQLATKWFTLQKPTVAAALENLPIALIWKLEKA